MAYTTNWDQVSASATNFHIPKLIDNFFLSNAFLYRLKGRQKEWEGGPVLVVPLGFAPEGGGGSWYAGADKFDTTIRNPIKAANYFAKNAQVTLAIDSDEELAVKGPRQVLSLVDSKMTIAENTMVDLVGTNLYNNGTNQKAIGGLQFALPGNIQTVPQTYGGITCGGSAPALDTNGWWQGGADNTEYSTGNAGTFMITTPGTNPLSAAMSRAGLRAGATNMPTLILSNWGAWTDYHNSLAKNERYDRPQQGTDLAKAGFTNLMYRNAPWVVDERAPRGATNVLNPGAGVDSGLVAFECVYGICEKSLSLYYHPQRNFSFDGWRKAYDQDVRAGYIFHRTELCMNQRRGSFVISKVDTGKSLAP